MRDMCIDRDSQSCQKFYKKGDTYMKAKHKFESLTSLNLHEAHKVHEAV